MATVDQSAGTTGIVLFEDAQAALPGPPAFTRPVFDLKLGAMTLRQRIEWVAGRVARAALIRPHLTPLLAEADLSLFRPGASADSALDPSRRCLLINGAWVATEPVWRRIEALEPGQALATPEGGLVALQTRAHPPEQQLVASISAPGWDARGAGFGVVVVEDAWLLRRPWDAIAWHVDALRADLQWAVTGPGIERLSAAHAAASAVILRGEEAFVAEDVVVEGPAVLDSRGGPILLRRGVRVGPFSVLEGPLLVEEDARILGGRVAASSIGRGCKVRGEIEASAILDWSNKAHDGFLGHAYLGSWVNLGALTTNSDLKNNYGFVRMPVATGHGKMPERQSTGQLKVGCVLGDYVKTAIGTLLGAGTVAGTGTNLFGIDGVAPSWLPAFVWGAGAAAVAYDPERFLRTVDTVHARRDRRVSTATKDVLRGVYETTRPERDAWLTRRQDGRG